MKEIFKDIKGYEGLYQVSNLGNIRSLDRKIKNRNDIQKLHDSISNYHTQLMIMYKDIEVLENDN